MFEKRTTRKRQAGSRIVEDLPSSWRPISPGRVDTELTEEEMSELVVKGVVTSTLGSPLGTAGELKTEYRTVVYMRTEEGKGMDNPQHGHATEDDQDEQDFDEDPGHDG